MSSRRRKATIAGALVAVNVTAAFAVNLLTIGWNWVIFAVLGAASALWVVLEVLRGEPAERTSPLSSPALPRLPDTFVHRPELEDEIARRLTGRRRSTVGLTAALYGTGGFGKTVLAATVCRRDDVRRHFGDKIHWITLGTDVVGARLADAINDLVWRLTGERPGLTSPEMAAQAMRSALKGRALLVVDDAWSAEQVRPLLDTGLGYTLLITTRASGVLPQDASAVQIDRMREEQARALVTTEVHDLPDADRERLLTATGRWPLALALVNGALRRKIRDGIGPGRAAAEIVTRIGEHGPATLRDPSRPDQAVAATLESSLSLLGDRRDRVLELGVFPEDTDIPKELAADLWRHSSGLSVHDADRLCTELVELSVAIAVEGEPAVRLHDAIRAYLRHERGSEQAGLHKSLLTGMAERYRLSEDGVTAWWRAPDSAEYLWRNLTYHLAEAGRRTEVVTLVTEPAWVLGKLRRLGPVPLAQDLALTGSADPDPERAGYVAELSRLLVHAGHLLTPTEPPHALASVLASRLDGNPTLEPLREAASRIISPVHRLISRHALPDLPDPALIRVLTGHEGVVYGCAFAPDGSWLASAGSDGTVRIWDPNDGRTISVLEGHRGEVNDCAASPDGRWLASCGDDQTVRVWETTTWQQIHVLHGHRDWVRTCAFSPDGALLVSGGDDAIIKVWDASEFHEVRTRKDLCGSVRACTVIARRKHRPCRRHGWRGSSFVRGRRSVVALGEDQ